MMFHRKKLGKWTLKDVGDHWDHTEDYDDINAETYSYYRRFIDGYKYSSMKGWTKPAKILDICCRTGNGTLYFGKRKKNFSFVCADVSPKMMDIADFAMKGKGISYDKKIFLSHRLPFRDGEFDGIICFETLEHVPKPGIFLKELARVLKDDGEIVLTMPNLLWDPIHWFAAVTHIHHSEGPHRFMSRKEFYRYVSRARLKVKKEVTTVLIPFGPRWLTRLGERLESGLGEWFNRLFALRRVFIIRKLNRR